MVRTCSVHGLESIVKAARCEIDELRCERTLFAMAWDAGAFHQSGLFGRVDVVIALTQGWSYKPPVSVYQTFGLCSRSPTHMVSTTSRGKS
jgi:hypothetical protein